MAKVAENLGVAVQGSDYTVVKKAGKKGETVEKHDHPEANVLFTVVKGHMEVTIGDKEVFNVVPGQILSFDGSNTISAKFVEDSEFFVTLILKR